MLWRQTSESDDMDCGGGSLSSKKLGPIGHVMPFAISVLRPYLNAEDMTYTLQLELDLIYIGFGM